MRFRPRVTGFLSSGGFVEIAQGFQESEDIRTGDLGSRGVSAHRGFKHSGNFWSQGISGLKEFSTQRILGIMGF